MKSLRAHETHRLPSGAVHRLQARHKLKLIIGLGTLWGTPMLNLQSYSRRFAKRQTFVAVSQVGEWRLALRGWQHRAFEAWSAKRPIDALIVATPGAGKTRFAARVVHAALAARDVARVIVVVPREHLKGQVARVFAQSGIQLDHAFANATRTLASDVDGAVVTYQQVAAAPRLFRDLVRVALARRGRVECRCAGCTILRGALGPGTVTRYVAHRSH